MNLSCAHCHDAQWASGCSRNHQPGPPNAYPAYRMEWQTMGSLERRLRACLSGIRAEMLPTARRNTSTRALSRLAARRGCDRDSRVRR